MTNGLTAGRHGIVAALLAAMILLASCAEQADTAADEAWLELFNGSDLDDWIPKIRGYPAGENFADTFRVEDGLLTVSYAGYDRFDGDYGHIFYQAPFSHYRLRVEYRFIGDPAPGTQDWAFRNSGAMLHSQPPHTMPPEQDFPISLELQFLGGLSDGDTRPTGNLCTPGTHVEYQGHFEDTHCLDSTSATYDGDQWVLAEALVLGSEKFVHYIHGVPVIEYANATYGGGVVAGHRPDMKPDGEPLGAGYISLQSEGHPVQFRKVELLNLKGCMDPEAGNYKRYFVADDPSVCRF